MKILLAAVEAVLIGLMYFICAHAFIDPSGGVLAGVVATSITTAVAVLIGWGLFVEGDER